MDVSIIIVNYNTTKLVVDSIKSIYQHTAGFDFEIIIIDNNSPIKDINIALTEFPDVKLLLNPQNVGFGGANNLGADIAKGEYLFFLNPDTLLLNNSIKYFLDFFKLDDSNKLSIGAVGSILLDENCNINGSYSDIYSTFSTEIMNSVISNFSVQEKKEKFLTQNCKEVAWVSGADLFIESSKFSKVGKFDENIFMYYEEVDLQKRLNTIGLKNYIIDGPKIIHLEGGAFDGKITVSKKKIIDRSKFYFYKKYSKNSMKFFLNKEIYKIFSWIKIYKDYGSKEAFNYLKFLNSL